MMEVEEIAKGLKDRRLSVVSRYTGLHRNTLARIRDGKATTLNDSTKVLLTRYFEHFDSQHVDGIGEQ